MDGAYKPGWFGRGLAWATALYLLLPITIVVPVNVLD